MRASRLLSILILLQMRGRVSAETLAQEFEVSVRTIYRDVDQLSAAGVPVYADRGRNGGFALMDGYRTRLTGFTPAEAEALLLAGAGHAASDLGLGADAAAAQLKLLASLPADSGASAQRIADRFHLDPLNWYRRAGQPTHLGELGAAVWRDRKIKITYESWKDTVTRELDPLGLVFKAGTWYLVAANEAKPRMYRVSNIKSLAVTDSPAQRPKNFNLARYWRDAASEFEARLLKDRATVKLSPRGRRLLHDISPAAAKAVEAEHRPCKPDGWIKATIPVEADEIAARQLLYLAADLEVLEPRTLRDALTTLARKVTAAYRAK